MKRSVFVRPAVCPLIVALALTASAVAQAQPVLNVSNLEGLYAAVNNPANAGAIVVMASGTYTLTAKDLNNQPRPNGGRLVLQSGMALVGQNRYVDFDGDGIWDPRDDNHDGFADTDPVRGLIFADPASETIIDAINLSGGGGGAVRIGLDNRVEKLTVRNTNRVSAGIDANVAPSVGGLLAEIRDCLVEDGQRGIRLRVIQDGIESVAVVARNITRRHTGSFGQGIEIIIQDTSNSSWDVTLRNNRVYENIFGLFVVGEGATNVRSHVLSVRNLYRENQLGLSITAGRDGGSGNNTHFRSVDDAVLNNGDGSADGRGGVLAIAGLISAAGADLSSHDALGLSDTIGAYCVRKKRPLAKS